MNNGKTIVILTGKAQSGKDTACDFMIERLAQNMLDKVQDDGQTWDFSDHFQKYSFAYALKCFCRDIFGVEEHKLFGTNDQKNEFTHIKWKDLPFASYITSSIRDYLDASPNEFLTGRHLLQVFGTDICRKMHNNCWAENTLRRIAQSNTEIAFISDSRFPNELDVFRLAKEKYDNIEDIIVIHLTRKVVDSVHASETALDNYNYHASFPNSYFRIDNEELNQQQKEEYLLNIMEIKGWNN